MKWLHTDKVVPELVSEMTAYESYIKTRWPSASIHVNADYAEDGHVADSEHYTGRAVDFTVPGVPLWEAWLALERFAFKGIGFYPHWNTPGFHADVRVAPFRARWMRDVGGQYVAFGAETLNQITTGLS